MYKTLIYNPILDSLVFIYQNMSFSDLGIAVILLTLLIRIVLFPLFWKSTKDQLIIQKIQPEVKRIQKEKKGDSQAQAKEMMALYKKHKLNPLSSIFLLIVQLPIFFALFKIFTSEISNGAFDNTLFLGFINLSDKGVELAFVAAVLQYIQLKLSMKLAPQKGGMSPQKIMIIAAPILTVVILWNLPKALSLYWIAMTVFSIIQQIIMNKHVAKNEKKEKNGKS